MTESALMDTTANVHLLSWHRDRFFRKPKDAPAKSRYPNEENTGLLCVNKGGTATITSSLDWEEVFLLFK